MREKGDLLLVRKKTYGFTIIELMVTLVIAAGLLSASIMTMSGYIPKQRLLSSMNTVEQALSQAQYEATSRVLWSCITYNQPINTLEIYMDQNADRVCNNGSDYLIGSHVLSTGVGFATCSSGDGTPFDEGDQSMWFNTSGAPILCESGGANCTIVSVEFIVSNPNLPSGNRAREIEVASSGLIEIVDRGEVGYNTATHANTTTGSTINGCE
ncbi:MAG: prepilin-type N-terminal cleavage/methylation domain-containing protein [Deltaproteobacteria bacterium]|nr:prepilin-type N-terminal cleavage/methylation domain-containing protein [Deltaproteobacteria bacterium]